MSCQRFGIGIKEDFVEVLPIIETLSFKRFGGIYQAGDSNLEAAKFEGEIDAVANSVVNPPLFI
jgi:hypothetical protein